MNVEGLFGLLALGTVLFATQMLIRKSIWDIPMILGAMFCFVTTGYGFFKLAFGG